MSGESVSGRADQLRSAASAVPSGAVNELHTAIEQLRDQLAFIIGDNSAEAVGVAQQQADAAAELFRNLMALRRKLITVADHHSGVAPPAGGGTSGGGPPGSSGPQSVTGPDGSNYPPDAQDPSILPPRGGPEGSNRTTGNAMINGRPIGQLVSGNVDPTNGQRDRYVRVARDRLAACGVDLWNANHVEVKLVGRMQDVRARDAEITINNYPCGYGEAFSGCHDVLERILPVGTSLTVKGTHDQGKQPFKRVYRGKGPEWDR